MKEIASTLKNQKEYTFRSFDKTFFINQSSCQSLFNGSTFRECIIKHSNFADSDFEGTIFCDTKFQESNMSSCDIKSSYFQNCDFVNCDFSLCAMSDSEFKNCHFENCLFNDANIRENIFENCTFLKGSYKMSTISLCKFEDSKFEQMILGNCSFYDHIMGRCDYIDVTINIDAMGRLYGLIPDDFRKFKYIFLGKNYGYAPNDFFDKLDMIFENKEWRLQKLLYQLNSRKCSTYDYIIEAFNVLTYCINNNIIVKHDDLLFLANIISVMKSSNKLPLFALYQGINNLSENATKLIEKKYYNKDEIFREFLNKMFFIFNELLAEYSSLFPENIEVGAQNENVLIKIHYEGNHTIDFSKYINSFLDFAGYDNSYYCYLSDTQNGSIIEILVGSIICVYALQILLYGINGVIIQLTDMTSKINVLKNKNYQKDFLSNSVKGRQRQPELLENTFALLNNKEFQKNIGSLASDLNSSKIIDIITKENPL